MYLTRSIDENLTAWRQDKQGKPLLLRGARQVGKSTAVRHLALQFGHFLEVNFEEQRQVHLLELLESNYLELTLGDQAAIVGHLVQGTMNHLDIEGQVSVDLAQ